MKKLYIIGAGGFGREVAWLVERINEESKEWDIIGFIDDNKNIHGNKEGNYFVIGDCEELAHVKDDEVWVVCAVGNAEIRRKLIEKIEHYSNIRFATLVDPSVIMSSHIHIGEGTIICAGTIITVDVSIGKHVIINLDCTIGHDAKISDYVTIYPSVNVSGNVNVGECVELGTATQIIQGKSVGQHSIIGAGSAVVKDIPEKCTAVGVPAKPIKYRE